VQPNPDPKPGRWILPVVILAMMGFAWLFINAAEDPTVSATDTTRSTGNGGSVTTTTTVAPATTTTTSLPPDVVQYNLDITAAGIDMAGLQERMVKINADWDSRAVSYADTLAALRTLDGEIRTWRQGLDSITIPNSLPQYADFHAIMVSAAAEIPSRSSEVIEGLQAPDSGELRRAALAAFNEAVTAYGNQVNTIAAYRPGN
jgi:hypothetical protein